jgi:hypothetical protein
VVRVVGAGGGDVEEASNELFIIIYEAKIKIQF